MKMVEKMDMSYSYKPVLLKAVLAKADKSGKVKISDLADISEAFMRIVEDEDWRLKR